MKLMILGAGKVQLNAIIRAKKMGYKVLVTDYYEDSPGKKIADEKDFASTFDYEATLEVAKNKNIDGIMTVGTDQPVYIVNKVAEQLNLPRFLDASTAYNVTNKKAMKFILQKNNIPITAYRIIKKNFIDKDIEGLKFPLVMKPLDSQGQRGIFKVYSIDGIHAHFDEVLSYSREKEILLETYYENDEITVSGWVRKGILKVITITDRVTFEDDVHIGVCSSHEFPSKHYKKYSEEIIKISEKIVEKFNINEGPIYFQMLIGKEGIKVNEIACRIGGAYEDEFIPLITEIDILKMVIDFSIGNEVDYSALEKYDIMKNKNFLSSQLFFAKTGKIMRMTDVNEIKKLDGLYNMNFNYDIGDVIEARVNATQRAGYMILTGKDEKDIRNNIEKAYNSLKIIDKQGENLVVKGKRGKVQ